MLRSTSASTWRAVSLSSTTRARLPCRSVRSTRVGAAAFVLLTSRTVNQKVLPWPRVLSTPTVPPIRLASCLVMAKPRPVPPYWRVVVLSAC